MASPLIVLQSHPLPESWVERDRIWTLLVQMSKDEVPDSRVQLPDPGRHDRDGKRCFVVGGHFLLSLFLGTQTGTALTLENGVSSMRQPFSHTSGNGVPHHELLRQFVLDEVQALWAQRDRHGAPARLNGFSGEQAVDLVEDLLQLGAWV